VRVKEVDYTKLFWDMIEAFDNITITSKKVLEENLFKKR